MLDTDCDVVEYEALLVFEVMYVLLRLSRTLSDDEKLAREGSTDALVELSGR